MSSETPSNAANNSNLVDLLSTLNPAAAAAVSSSSTMLTPSTATTRNDDMNVDSSDFVPANRLLTQRQALNNHKQRLLKYSFRFYLSFCLFS
jgi:hypothetical protein